MNPALARPLLLRKLLVADLYSPLDRSRESNGLARPAVSREYRGEIWNRVGMLSSRQMFNDLSTSLVKYGLSTPALLTIEEGS